MESNIEHQSQQQTVLSWVSDVGWLSVCLIGYLHYTASRPDIDYLSNLIVVVNKTEAQTLFTIILLYIVHYYIKYGNDGEVLVSTSVSVLKHWQLHWGTSAAPGEFQTMILATGTSRRV